MVFCVFFAKLASLSISDQRKFRDYVGFLDLGDFVDVKESPSGDRRKLGLDKARTRYYNLIHEYPIFYEKYNIASILTTFIFVFLYL